MLDLFGDLADTPVDSVVTSGVVPRDYCGLLWGQAEEAQFAEFYRSMRTGRLCMSEDAAAREARWVVEADMIRRHFAGQMRRVKACRSDDEKRRLVAEWREKFGHERADDLVCKARSPAFVEMAVKWK